MDRKELIKSFFNSISEFIFPKTCVITDEILTSSNSNPIVKDSILEGLQTITVDEIVNFGKTLLANDFFCLYRYTRNSHIQTLIHHMKYNGYYKIGTLLGNRLSEILLAKLPVLSSSCKIICPIPLHPTKLRDRGYNQTQYITEAIATKLPIPLLPDLLKRIKNTKTQTQLNIQERKENMKDAFIVNPKYRNLIQNKRIMLVDDIVTSGATANEATRVLRAAGARGIFLVALCKTCD
ncbi:MAG: ComF family protein [Ignavibacteria bacterium]